MPQSTQPPSAPKNQEYGQRGAQLASQRNQPIAASPLVGSATGKAGRPRTTQPGQDAGGGLQPGQIPSLADPTARPNEPLTAGLPLGQGPGPEALTAASFGPEELSVLRGIMLQYPNDDIRRQLEWTERNLG